MKKILYRGMIKKTLFLARKKTNDEIKVEFYEDSEYSLLTIKYSTSEFKRCHTSIFDKECLELSIEFTS